MITKKIKKHLSIAKTRLNQNSELKKIAKYNNASLNKIAQALLSTVRTQFSTDDLQAFERCEKIRSELLANETVISYEIFGSDNTALVKDICRKGASNKKECQFLYLLSKQVEHPVVLEIGTNVGMSGCYILEGLKDSSSGFLVTMEGLPQLCEIANELFATIAPNTKFEIKQGLFDTTFPEVIAGDKNFNLLFIDGNHQKEATIDYFNSLKHKIESPAILVFDDINWSPGMQEAWRTIKNDPAVNFAIDLYRQGIIIIDKKEPAKNVDFSLHLSY